MKTENKLLIIFSGFILLVFLTGYYLHFNSTLSSPVWIAFITGGSLTTLNFYLGILSLRIALNAPNNRFLAIVFGGMLTRMLFMLVVIYIGVKLLEIRMDVFIFVIFVFYTIYLLFEIFYFYLLKGKHTD
jgi:hypothetical protein